MSSLLKNIKFKKPLLLLFSMLLASCSSLFKNQVVDLLRMDASANSDFYIKKIDRNLFFQDQQTYKLLAARALVRENKIAQAEALLAELVNLKAEQSLERSLIKALISAIKNQNLNAERQLKNIDLSMLSVSQKARYYDVVARIAENKPNTLEAVRVLIQREILITDLEQKQANIDRIWALLRKTNKNAVDSTLTQNDTVLTGWLALAQAYNNNINQPIALSEALQTWQQTHLEHSAAHQLPTELKNLFNFQPTKLNRVTLLLPLSGSNQTIGHIVKAGFENARGNDSEIEIDVIDTMKTDVLTAIKLAKASGSKTIVGPLLKANVDKILNNAKLLEGINVLALNATANARAISQLCYYGLAPEDEAESAANKMWQDGIRLPLIIAPNNDLGQRTANAFTLRWQQLSGKNAYLSFYDQVQDVASSLEDGFLQNAEAMYVIALGEQLSKMKLAIDNFNPNIKLYASSRINSANNARAYRLQMNGLQFSDIPLFKETSTEKYQKIEQQTEGDYSLMRLYAMGADAWLLINTFNELSQIPGYTISGLTGILNAGPNCNIERDMTWFQYKNGNVHILKN